jgi:hypothetical protein
MNDSDLTNIVFTRSAELQALIACEVIVAFNMEDPADTAVSTAVNRAVYEVKKHLTFFRTHNVVCPRPIRNYTFQILSHWMRTPPKQRETLSVEMTSGELASSVGSYACRFHLPVNNPKFEAGYVQVSLPMSVGLQKADIVRQLLTDIATLLPTFWAKAGFAIEYNRYRIIPERDQQISAWCARYECVDHRDLDVVATAVLRCVPSVNWLNIVKKDFLDHATAINGNGIARGEQLMKDGLYLFSAGDRPLLGDRNRNEDITGYRRVYAALRSAMCASPPVLAGFDDDRLADWFQRFDED